MARRRKKRFRKLRFLLKVLILVILAVALFAAAKISKVNKGGIAEAKVINNESIPSDELNKMKDYTSIALFGLDSRSGQLESGANSDTIMICSINDITKEIKLVSVYRDTYLDDSTGNYRKCTEVYAMGGAEQAISMLNKNLDLNITDYVTVNFEALVELVDLFGGVDINLTEGEVQWLNSYLVEGREVLGKECEDVKGFCKVATIAEVTEQDYILTPGRYVGIEEVEDDGEPFEEKMSRLTTELYGLFEESHHLEAEIRKKLAAIGYGE